MQLWLILIRSNFVQGLRIEFLAADQSLHGWCMKKIVFVSVLLVLFSVSLGALPGITEYIPTQSGEYVYYRDYTFEEETYIGFLQYDKGTYAVRYYSPKPKQGSADIHILFSMDPDAVNVELTGEKILTEVTSDDVDTVNYLHDLLYEFNARRKKVNGKKFTSTLKISEMFELFGGDVTMVYEGYIPLYSLDSIRSDKGDILFQAVTMGVILDSEDTTFSRFKGFENLPPLTSGKDSKKNIDDQWLSDAEGYWTMGDDALFLMNTVEIDAEEYLKNGYSVEDFFTRYFLLSTGGSYFYLPYTSIENKGGAASPSLLLVNTALSFSGESTYTKDFKVLLKESNNRYWFYVLTVYEKFYKEHKSYFDEFAKNLIP